MVGFFSVTGNDLLQKNEIIIQELTIPETGKIKFNITDSNNQPVLNASVKNWIYSFSAEGGFTDWLELLPTTSEPYVAEVILPNHTMVRSEPFWLFPGEQKIINILVKDESSKYDIPSWIKNNAGWWAGGYIDDDSFVQGIQFLIKEGIMQIPPTSQGSSTGSNEIPSWIKNNAGWWADGQIDDDSFVQGIQFLIKEGILRIQS